MTPSTSLAGKRVLITGAEGFIGTRLVRRLETESADVYGLVSRKRAPATRGRPKGGATFLKADIRELRDVQAVIARVKPHVIVHLATFGNRPEHYTVSPRDEILRIVSTNVLGTANLIAAAGQLVDLECFVNTGSAFAEYGPGSKPMREAQRLDPDTYYGATKAAASLLVTAFGKLRRKSVVTLRPLYVYGPGESPSRFIPTAISKGLRGETLSLTSLGEKKDFVFIDDVVDAYRRACSLTQGGPPFLNIGSARESTLGEVLRIVEGYLGKPIRYEEGSYRRLQWPSERWTANIALAKRVLGWRPTTDLETGIRKTVDRAIEDENRRCGRS